MESSVGDANGLGPDALPSLAEHWPFPVVVLDEARRIAYANPAVGTALGRPVGEILGTRFETLVHPADELGPATSEAAPANRRHEVDASSLRHVRLAHAGEGWRAFRFVALPLGADSRYTALYGTAPAGTASATLASLPDRADLVARLRRTLDRRKHVPAYRFAVLAVDVDRFDLACRGLGAAGADALLAATADRLIRCVRPSDLVAHLGSDEFAVLLDHLDPSDDGTRVAARICKALAEPVQVDQRDVSLTASVGVSTVAEVGVGAEELLREASHAVRRAKRGNRGGYEVHDPRLRQAAAERLRLEEELKRGIERREFTLHYQPIVSLASGRITGFEGLARWRHPERGLLAPGGFIVAAEETGLVIPIAVQLLAEGCARVAGWLERGHELSLSMNITSTHFRRAGAVADVEAALASASLPGRHLIVEITETVMMENLELVAPVLGELKTRGLEIHVDDFGTGYSSLAYLQRLPVDALKVDRSFVERLGTDRASDAIVRAIVELGHTLGFKVLAEGIETPAQLATVRALGCEYAQGYHFARPLDAAAATALLEAAPHW